VSNYMIQNRGEFASVPPPHHHHHHHLATKSWTPAPTLGPLFLLRALPLYCRATGRGQAGAGGPPDARADRRVQAKEYVLLTHKTTQHVELTPDMQTHQSLARTNVSCMTSTATTPPSGSCAASRSRYDGTRPVSVDKGTTS
jgi:hypothetical protein